MKEADVERLVERARELHPGVSPRIISDNGPQFIAGDFKQYIRLTGMTHVRTSPYYPQSNGKIERWHKTLKADAIRVKTPATREEAHRVVADVVEHYNNKRLHSAIDYVTPADRLAGHHKAIVAARDSKLETARERRAAWRQGACAPLRARSTNPGGVAPPWQRRFRACPPAQAAARRPRSSSIFL